MKLTQLTLRWDPSVSAFDAQPLEAFCANHDVLEVFEHLMVHEGRPAWALLIKHRAARADPLAVERIADLPKDARNELPAEERELYEALRRWRNDRAQRDGKPPYVIFTNNQMIAVAKKRPRTKEQLSEVPGVGESKLANFGDEVLAVVGAVPFGATGEEASGAEPNAGGPNGG